MAGNLTRYPLIIWVTSSEFLFSSTTPLLFFLCVYLVYGPEAYEDREMQFSI